MNRNEILEAICFAKTLEDCQKAWRLRADYLRAHPDDDAMIDAGESLSMLEKALLSAGKEKELISVS